MAQSRHAIPFPEAAKLTYAWRRNRPPGSFNGARFDRVAFENILSQPGCEGIRIYMGLHDAGDLGYEDAKSFWTFVMVGTDADGNDMTVIPGDGNPDSISGGEDTYGDTEQMPLPCPPWCGDPGPLNTPP